MGLGIGKQLNKNTTPTVMSLCNAIPHFLTLQSFLICDSSRIVSKGVAVVKTVGGGLVWIRGGEDVGVEEPGWSMTHPNTKVSRIKEKSHFSTRLLDSSSHRLGGREQLHSGNVCCPFNALTCKVIMLF